MGGFATFRMESGLLCLIKLPFYHLVHVMLTYSVTTFHELQIFKFGAKDGKPSSALLQEHTYILQPVTGNAKYSKQSPNMSVNSDQPLQRAVVNLDDVTLCLSKVGHSIFAFCLAG